MIKVRVQGKEYSFPDGRWSLAELLGSVGYGIPLPCAGLGNCGKCQIRVRGNVEIVESDRKLIPEERLKGGYILACRKRAISGVVEVELPPVKERKVTHIEEAVVDVVTGGMDLGTTSIVLNFLPEEGGEVFYSSSFLNPQSNYGADVISRATFIGDKEENLRLLQKKVADKISREIEEVKRISGVDKIKLLAVAGNSIMEHIFSGNNPLPLTTFPFKLSFKNGFEMEGRDLFLDSVEKVYFFPLIGSYVGGDTVALLVDIDPFSSSAKRVILDIGTNGEIVVQNEREFLATAASAGPAFEGGNIKFGMRAGEGAIERVWMEDERLRLDVIGDKPPEGICGSGIMDAVALMVKEGVVDPDGAICSPAEIDSPLFNRVVEKNGERVFILYRDAKREIYLTQKDIREFQLAKGAIRAGIEVLMNKLGLQWDEIHEVIVAGAFGSYLTEEGLTGVNMVPEKIGDRIKFVGDGVIRGIRRVLENGDLELPEKIAEEVEYLELSLEENFQDLFLNSLALKEY